MAKTIKKAATKAATKPKKPAVRAAPVAKKSKIAARKAAVALQAASTLPVTKKTAPKKSVIKKAVAKKMVRALMPKRLVNGVLPIPEHSGVEVLDLLYATINSRRGVDPSVSHSARLLSRGTGKVAQKFGEEAVECVIEAVAGNRTALIAESADVLYHLLVLWVDAGVMPHEVWAELERRQGVSGIVEKAARAQKLSMAFGLGTTKIP
jgi:phosphoribosyl-ATP pyrophosphohydrolase